MDVHVNPRIHIVHIIQCTCTVVHVCSHKIIYHNFLNFHVKFNFVLKWKDKNQVYIASIISVVVSNNGLCKTKLNVHEHFSHEIFMDESKANKCTKVRIPRLLCFLSRKSSDSTSQPHLETSSKHPKVHRVPREHNSQP